VESFEPGNSGPELVTNTQITTNLKGYVISLQERAKLEAKSYLEQLLSEGARKLLQAAIENEVSEYLQGHRDQRSELGERSVVRNGHVPERDLVTGVGPVKDSAADYRPPISCDSKPVGRLITRPGANVI